MIKKFVVIFLIVSMFILSACSDDTPGLVFEESMDNSSENSNQSESISDSGSTNGSPTVNFTQIDDEKTSSNNKKPTYSTSSDEKHSQKGDSNMNNNENNWVPGIAPSVGASVSETPLSNTYKLLTQEKKLTIGYLGGSITLGTSALKVVQNGTVTSNKGGDIMDSWVNRVSSWFKAEYPNAKIETVNAGVSDTPTSLGIFRLEKMLMNADGHDVPDLVFIEFTHNDFIYPQQTVEDLKIQIESLFRNIWKHNPCAEIVVISTNTIASRESIAAYREVSAHYGIPFVDVGAKLSQLMREKHGVNYETYGTYYYTADNLHPSALGYKVYFDTIKETLAPYLSFSIKSDKLFDYNASLPTTLATHLIDNPKMIALSVADVRGNATVVNTPILFPAFGTETYTTDTVMARSYSALEKGAKFTTQFNGCFLGVFVKTNENIDMMFKYRIDGGAWKTFGFNDNTMPTHRKNRSQGYMFEHNLSNKAHSLEVEVISDNMNLISLLVDE